MNHELTTIIKAIEEKKGSDIIVYDFHQCNPFIDYTIIASATNLLQVYALAENVVDRAHEAQIAVRRMEGEKDSAWILVDLNTIIVHIFLAEERSVYRLEQLYADLPILDSCA